MEININLTNNYVGQIMINKEFQIEEGGLLKIFPSTASSHTDFDFYIGKWNIRNKKLNERLNNCNEWTEFNSTDHTTQLLMVLLI